MSKKSPRKQKRQNSKKRKSKPVDSSHLSYEQLEDKNLLAVDFGLNFTGATFGADTSSQVAEAQGDIGTTHAIEVINGRYAAFDRFTGGRIVDSTLEDFFIAAGGSPFSALDTPRVVFDHASERFFVGAISQGNGNWLHVAFSNTSDPRDGWQTLQFVGDSTSARHSADLTISVDADAVYMTSNNVSPFVQDYSAIYSIPKTDLFAADPTLTNMSRFETLDPEVYGSTVQVAINHEASDGKAVALGWIDYATVAMIEIYDTDAAGATLSAPIEIKVDIGEGIEDIDNKYVPGIAHDDYNGNLDEYFREPDVPTQGDSPFGPQLEVKPGITASITEVNGSLWAAHTVSIVGIQFQSMINVFEIDIDAGRVRGDTYAEAPDGLNNQYQFERAAALQDPFVVELRGPQSHLIRAEPIGDDPNIYLFNPSIAVNEYGLVAVSYNQIFEDQFIGSFASVGVSVEGANRHNVQFDWTDPISHFPNNDPDVALGNIHTISPGLELYNPASTVEGWAGGSLRVDPLLDNGFWSTQLWANVDHSWSVQNSQYLLVDMNPIIEGTNGRDDIVVRRNAANNDLLEVEINGVVTDMFPYSSLGRVELWAHDDADNFLIDYSNGDPTPSNGFLFFGGEGTDQLVTNDPVGSEFMVVEPNHRELDITVASFSTNFPRYLNQYRVVFGDDPTNSNGFYNTTSEFFDVEDLFGGPGNDSFIFTGDHLLSGSANGRGGDDTFSWVDNPLVPGLSGVDGSIEGGTGYDTLVFQDRETETVIELIETGVALDGFSGRTEIPDAIDPATGAPFTEGPIGNEDTDNLFFNINNIVGSTLHFTDEITSLDRPGSEWIVDDENSSYSVDGATINFFNVNVLNGSSFADTYYIVSNTVNPVFLYGLGGDDVYTFSSDKSATSGTTENIQSQVFAFAGEGNNKLFATNIDGSGPVDALIIANSVTGLGEFAFGALGGTIDVEITATPFDDKLALHSYNPNNTLKVFADEGNDEFSIQDLSKALVEAHGEGGDDTYVVERVQDVDFRNLEIIDSIGSENDLVTLAGSILNETWNISNTSFADSNVAYSGIERFGVDGRGGFDVFNIVETSFELFVTGGDRDDIFNISSDAPANTGHLQNIIGDLTINGGRGLNRMTVSNFGGTGLIADIYDDHMEGMIGGTLFYMNEGNGRFAKADGSVGGITLVGSNLENDTFNIIGNVQTNTMLVGTLGGNDRIYLGADLDGQVEVDGGADMDTYDLEFLGSGNSNIAIEDTGGVPDRANIIGTSGADVINVTSTQISRGAEVFSFVNPINFLGVQGRQGDDTFNLNGSMAPTTHLLAEQGDDIFNINNTVGIVGLRNAGHAGNDTFNYNGVDAGTTVRGVGSNDDDVFNVGVGALGTFSINGQDGSDTYNIDIVGSGDRWVNARDSGVIGYDVTTVNGTTGVDSFEIRANRVLEGNETVVFGPGNNEIIVDGLAGNDNIGMFASVAPITKIMGNTGNDILKVNSTSRADQLEISGGFGNDIALVLNTHSTTTTTISGDQGDDNFLIGSTAANDNGNLGKIRGSVSVLGGENTTHGVDLLYVNDHGVNGGYSYEVTPTSVGHWDGPFLIGRTQAATVNYGGVESLRLDGTPLFNYFKVTPSPNTRYFIDGNSPTEAFGDSIELQATPGDGHVLFRTNNVLGQGYWTFTNGFQIVRYDNIEFIENPPSSLPRMPMTFSSSMYRPGFYHQDGNAKVAGPMTLAEMDALILAEAQELAIQEASDPSVFLMDQEVLDEVDELVRDAFFELA